MKDLSRRVFYKQSLLYWRYVVLLMGSGDMLDEAGPPKMDEVLSWDSKEDDPKAYGVAMSLKIRLRTMFGQYDEAADLSLKVGDSYNTVAPAHGSIMADTFCRGLALVAIARKKNLRKYKFAAKKIHSIIKKWVSKGNPNVKHYDKLMNAEMAALNGDSDVAEGWYQSTIVIAGRAGILYDAALAK